MKMEFGINGTIIRLSSMLIAMTFFFTSCSSFEARRNMFLDKEPPRKQMFVEGLKAFKEKVTNSCNSGCLSCNKSLNPSSEEMDGIFAPYFDAYHEKCLNAGKKFTCKGCIVCNLHPKISMKISDIFKNIEALEQLLNNQACVFLNGESFCLYESLINILSPSSFPKSLKNRLSVYIIIKDMLKPLSLSYTPVAIMNIIELAERILQNNFNFIPHNHLFDNICGISFLYSFCEIYYATNPQKRSFDFYKKVRNDTEELFNHLIFEQELKGPLYPDCRLQYAMEEEASYLCERLDVYEGDNERVCNYFQNCIGELYRFKTAINSQYWISSCKELWSQKNESSTEWCFLEVLRQASVRLFIQENDRIKEEEKKREEEKEKVIKGTSKN